MESGIHLLAGNGCWETITESYIANEPEDQLMVLFDSNMAYGQQESLPCSDVPMGCTEARQ